MRKIEWWTANEREALERIIAVFIHEEWQGDTAKVEAIREILEAGGFIEAE